MKQGIYDIPVFLALVQHERNRVDRDGKEFAMAIFQSGGLGTWDSVAVIEKIKKCMRDIDEVGWLDGKNIGVLLPATTMDGGHRFARRVAGKQTEGKKCIPFRVFSYPRHWITAVADGASYSPSNCDDEEAAPASLRSIFLQRIPVWKRALDVFGSLFGIVALSPLFLGVAAYIKIASPGPVFFRQERVGRGGSIFRIFKFRTMHANNDQVAHQEHILKRMCTKENSLDKLDDFDPRIYRGGKFLRKTCIDELPQLFNVLRGEMSLVGPRPCLPYEADVFLRWHRKRFDVQPGMTGLWQVSGKNKLTFLQMIRLDISYAKRLSLKNDLIILLRTFPTIVEIIADSQRAKRMPKVPEKAESRLAPLPAAEPAAQLAGRLAVQVPLPELHAAPQQKASSDLAL